MIQMNKVLYEQRKKKGLTQQEVANYLLVSKASVSKWEKGISYPDLTMLPKLASFYQITLDELFSYEVLLSKNEIKQMYEECATAFNKQSFEEVYQKIQQYLGMYFGSDELQMQLNILLLNHAQDSTNKKEILEEVVERFHKLQGSKDHRIVNQALHLESVTYLFLQEYEKIIELYKEDDYLIFNNAYILGSAYILKNDFKEANKVLEIRMFQDVLLLLQNLMTYVSIHPEQLLEIEKKCTSVITLFNLETIHKGSVLPIYLQLASMYSTLDKEKTLYFIEEYTRVIITSTNFIHVESDVFFSRIKEWMEELNYSSFPRSEQTIKESMIEALQFECFNLVKEEERYKHCIVQLEEKLK